MKILAVERMAGCWPSEATAALESEQLVEPACIPLTLMADSAMVRRGMPMFIPDFALEWELEAMPYFTVGRLGKSIPPRFAHRYIDGWGVALRAVPQGKAYSAEALPGALAVGFDGAFAPGVKLPYAGQADAVIDVAGVGNVCLSTSDMRIEDTLALISRYMMLKTGDMILPCHTGLRVPVKLDTCVECTLNGVPAITLKIK